MCKAEDAEQRCSDCEDNNDDDDNRIIVVRRRDAVAAAVAANIPIIFLLFIFVDYSRYLEVIF